MNQKTNIQNSLKEYGNVIYERDQRESNVLNLCSINNITSSSNVSFTALIRIIIIPNVIRIENSFSPLFSPVFWI